MSVIIILISRYISISVILLVYHTFIDKTHQEVLKFEYVIQLEHPNLNINLIHFIL